jgi:hypothetical protein
VRAYFNRRGKEPWSIDFGPGTYEYKTAHIQLIGVTGFSKYAPEVGDNENTPTAWIEFPSSSILVMDDKILIERS